MNWSGLWENEPTHVWHSTEGWLSRLWTEKENERQWPGRQRPRTDRSGNTAKDPAPHSHDFSGQEYCSDQWGDIPAAPACPWHCLDPSPYTMEITATASATASGTLLPLIVYSQDDVLAVQGVGGKLVSNNPGLTRLLFFPPCNGLRATSQSRFLLFSYLFFTDL